VQRGEATLISEIRIGAFVEEEPRDVPVAACRRDDERRLAVIVASFIYIRARLQQHAPGLDVPLLRSEEERRETAFGAGTNIRCMVEEQLHERRRCIGGGPHQGRLTAIRFLRVHLGSTREQQARRVEVAVVNGGHERCLTRKERCIWIRLSLQEPSDQRDMSVRAGDEEGSCTIFVCCVDVCLRSYQKVGDFCMVPFDGQHEHRGAVRLRGVDIGALPQQLANGTRITLHDGIEQALGRSRRTGRLEGRRSLCFTQVLPAGLQDVSPRRRRGKMDTVASEAELHRHVLGSLRRSLASRDSGQQNRKEDGDRQPHRSILPVLSPKRSRWIPSVSSSVRYRFAIGVFSGSLT
jgi:hypothetical protein